MGRVCGLWDILLNYRITHPLFWMGEANVLLDSQTAGESNGSWWEKEMPDLPELTLEKDIKNSGKWKCWSEYIMWGQKTYQKIILHRRTQRTSFWKANRTVLVRETPAAQRKTTEADFYLQRRVACRRAFHGTWLISSSEDNGALKQQRMSNT